SLRPCVSWLCLFSSAEAPPPGGGPPPPPPPPQQPGQPLPDLPAGRGDRRHRLVGLPEQRPQLLPLAPRPLPRQLLPVALLQLLPGLLVEQQPGPAAPLQLAQGHLGAVRRGPAPPPPADALPPGPGPPLHLEAEVRHA